MEQAAQKVIKGIDVSKISESIGPLESTTMPEQVQEAIAKISKNPSSVMDVMNSFSDNPEVFTEITKFVKGDPNLSKLLQGGSIQSTPGARSVAAKTSRRQQMKLQKQMKRAMAPPKGETVVTARMTSSRQLKTKEVSTNFPAGTEWDNYDPVAMDDENSLHAFFCTTEGRVHKKLRKAAQQDLYGEIIFFRLDENGDKSPVSVQEVKSLM